LGYLEEAFLFEGAKRYNIKGNKYFESIKKYYVVDVGLRNAKLNFRQQEITHIMENVIYNELRMQGFSVDVGLVESREMRNGKLEYIQYEVDFIANNGADKYYIQSAFALNDEEKRQQELNSLLKIGNSFQKIVIVGQDIAEYTDNKGIRFMGLFQFLQSGLSGL
jgi:predicted AAA+ superfamily ATPase